MKIKQAPMAKFTNLGGSVVTLVVGQGGNISDVVYRCEPGGVMEGPVNYTDFFQRNGLALTNDAEIEDAKRSAMLEAMAKAEVDAKAREEERAKAKAKADAIKAAAEADAKARGK